LANDKTLESLNVKIETLSSTLKSQLSFNKMIETQLAQIAASLPAVENGKISGQPETPVENVSIVSTGWGNPSRRSSCTNHAGRRNPPKNNSWDGLVVAVQEDLGVPMISCSIYDKHTTTHVGLCDVPLTSLKVLFSLCFIIYDACVMKIRSSPIPCNKRSFVMKTYFFVINLVTIVLSS